VEGVRGVHEHYARKVIVDTFGKRGTYVTTEGYQPSLFRHGLFLCKGRSSRSRIDDFVVAGRLIPQHASQQETDAAFPETYRRLWGGMTSSIWRIGNLNGRENPIAEYVVRETYLYTLMNAYMRKYEAMAFDMDDARFRVRWGADLIAEVDRKSNRFSLTQDGVTIADGNDRFIPAPDDSLKIYVYGLEGSNRGWTLPARWRRLAHVDRYELTECGPAFIDRLPVVKGRVRLTVPAGIPYRLQPAADTLPPVGPINRALRGKVSASSGVAGAGNAVDGDPSSAWTPQAPAGAWIEVEFGRETEVNRVELREQGNSVQAYRLQYWAAPDWVQVCAGKTIGKRAQHCFPNIRTERLRLVIDGSEGNPRIGELQVFADANLAMTARAATASSSLKFDELKRDSNIWWWDVSAARAMDGTAETAWVSGTKDRAWLTAHFQRPSTFNRFVIAEEGQAVTAFYIDCWNGKTWKTVHKGGKAIGRHLQIDIPRERGHAVRLVIEGAKSPPAIAEFAVFDVGGVLAPPPPPKPGTVIRVNDSSPRIAKSGALYHTGRGDLGDYKDDLHNISGGGFYTFTFEGTGIRWIGEKESVSGNANVYIDGRRVATVNNANDKRLVQQVLYEKTDLPDGRHTIHVEHVSGNCTLDAFEYIVGE